MSAVEREKVTGTWPAPVRQAARAAFALRLQQTRQAQVARGAGSEIVDSEPLSDLEAVGEEELLRRVMVKLWPRVKQHRATAHETAQYFDYLFALEQRLTDTGDLRFFDAWNQAFEALAPATIPSGVEHAYDRFLAKYAQALEAQLSGLDPHARFDSL